MKSDRSEQIYRLKGISTLGALSAEAIDFLLENGEIQLSKENECLFRAGESSDGFYIITAGEVAFYKVNESGRAFIRNYQVGEHIGVVGMITLQKRVGDAVAIGNVETLFISTELFHKLYEFSNQDFVILLMNVVRDMARGLKMVDDLLVDHSD